MGICRVVQKPGGTLSVIRPSPNSRLPDEEESVWLDRIFTKHMKVREMIGFPFVDMDDSQLPSDRKMRNKWRLNPQDRVFVDPSVADLPHPKQTLLDQIDGATTLAEIRVAMKELLKG